MNRRELLRGGACGSVVFLVGCDRLSNTTISGKYLPNYRYKLTVEVDTPEGLKSGHSVIEVIKPWRPGASSRGQAVAVDLPGRQTLFVLLRSEQTSDWSDDAMAPAWPPIQRSGDEEKDVAALLRAARAMGRFQLPRVRKLGETGEMNHTPYFVRFGDVRDPTTVEKVDPDNMAHSFGEGVEFKGLFVEITDEPVSTGIERRLGWLRRPQANLLDLTREQEDAFIVNGQGYPLAARISFGDFKHEHLSAKEGVERARAINNFRNKTPRDAD